MNSSQKSILVSILASKNASINLVTMVAILKNIVKFENKYITYGRTRAKHSDFQPWLLVFIDAHITTFQQAQGFFWGLNIPDFTKRWKCYHVKKHPVLFYSADRLSRTFYEYCSRLFLPYQIKSFYWADEKNRQKVSLIQLKTCM